MKKWDEDESYSRKNNRDSKKISKTKFREMAHKIYLNRDVDEFDEGTEANWL